MLKYTMNRLLAVVLDTLNNPFLGLAAVLIALIIIAIY